MVQSAGEYVRCQVRFNDIVSFGALFKRGIVGSCHHVSMMHQFRCVAEFCDRQNPRGVPDIVFVASTYRLCVGGRLTYRHLVDGNAV